MGRTHRSDGNRATETHVHRPLTCMQFTASDVPPYWYRNHTVMKADTDLTHGAVTSPTFMHGLPFGTMIEAAHHYPSEDGLGQLQ